jgi:branched-chain amino acid transport system ATP-binding protein
VSPILAVQDLKRHFGGIAAIDGLDLHVLPNEILAICGPNGSGKTTLFNVISGVLRPTSGAVLFEGQRVDGFPAHRVVARGIGRTFQQAMAFPALSVRENVEIPLCALTGSEPDVDAILSLCGLAADAEQQAGMLPYGKQRNLGIAVALATRPKLLLLDEPSAGLGDEACHGLANLIRTIRSGGVTVVVIDHDMAFLLPLADRVIVMDAGKKLFEGTPDQVLAEERVIEVYLGNDFL